MVASGIDNTERDFIAEADAVAAEWRQGDLVLGDEWFVLRVDPVRSLIAAPPSAEAGTGDDELLEQTVAGLAVVTQTCDIVRTCTDRPYIEVCPLVAIDRLDHWREIAHGTRPRYAVVPALEEKRLVVDLDRTMTVEKSCLLGWTRTPGLASDAERRAFAEALARKRRRFAFPDDFTAVVRPLRAVLQRRAGKDSGEGAAVDSIREIRVRAAPSWDAEGVDVTLYFVLEDRPGPSREAMATIVDRWMVDLVNAAAGSRFQISWLVQSLDDMTARDLVESDPLDLDWLTPG